MAKVRGLHAGSPGTIAGAPALPWSRWGPYEADAGDLRQLRLLRPSKMH